MADDGLPSDALITFLHDFTRLLERQLLDVRSSMVTTVETVMEGVAGISSAAEGSQEHAEKVLDSTFVNPDAETGIIIEDLQSFVTEVFEEASDRLRAGKALDGIVSTDPEILVLNRISRLQNKFSGEMKNLDVLNDDLKNIVYGIMGALSSEDVISQKLHHAVLALRALQAGLDYLLSDFENRSTNEEFERVTSGIKSFTFRNYTTEEEKRRFLEIFQKGA